MAKQVGRFSRLLFRVTQREHDMAFALAARAGVSLSDWLRGLIIRADERARLESEAQDA